MFNIYSIFGILVALLLAAIPAAIASKKYYNGVAFYFYGLIAFLPALIHVICIPDKSVDGKEKASVESIVLAAIGGFVIILGIMFELSDFIVMRSAFGNSLIETISILCDYAYYGALLWFVILMYMGNNKNALKMNLIALCVISGASLVASIAFIIMFPGLTLAIRFGYCLPGIIEFIVKILSFMGFAYLISNYIKGKETSRGLFCFAPIVLFVLGGIFVFVIGNAIRVQADFPHDFIKKAVLMFIMGLYCYCVTKYPLADNIDAKGNTYMTPDTEI